MKRTKIIATIGPTTKSKEKIEELIEAGMNVARINFSHGSYESNGQLIDYVKELREEMNIPVGIIADLQGPRIRTLMEKEILIEDGEEILVFDSASIKKVVSDKLEKKHLTLDWAGIIKNIEIGNEILIEDGLMKIRVFKKENHFLRARVIEGGVVQDHKGVNIPDADLEIDAVTEKDKKDLKFVLGKDVDFIALSFVGRAKEIIDTREKMKKILGKSEQLPQIIAKIERKDAIKNIKEIIEVTDVIMIARGDLGIEMDESRVVIYQKELIMQCLKSATPVIVATQMLNSMIYNPRPTRAEVSDVSNAVIDNTDAVMLSGETANGKYPVEAVRVMYDIIKKTEHSSFDVLGHGFLGDKDASTSTAIAHAAHELLKDAKAQAVVAASISGFTARMISRHRLEKPFFVMTNNEKTHNQLTLVWGIESFVLAECKTLDELIDKSIETLKINKKIKTDDKVIIVTGRPGVSHEHMSLVKIEEVV